MNQQDFKYQYHEYTIYFKNKGIHVFCLDVYDLIKWIDITFKITMSTWSKTTEKINDRYSIEHTVYKYLGHKFICVFLSNILPPDVSVTIVGVNNLAVHPVYFDGVSYFDNKDRLVYYHDDSQKQFIHQLYLKNKPLHETCKKYHVIKEKITENKWTPVSKSIVMMHLEQGYPTKMNGLNFLCSQVSYLSFNGIPIYKHFMKSGEKWYVRHSSVTQFNELEKKNPSQQ